MHLFRRRADGELAAGTVLVRSRPTRPGSAEVDLEAASPCLVDWDGDGDLDVVAGVRTGKIYLLRNTGTRTAPKFADPTEILADGKPFDTWIAHSGPCAADWDGDGKTDLVVGDEKGVWFARNVGATAPEFAEPEKLPIDVKALGGAYRFKPCVVDWNGDGRTDLVLGTCFPATRRRTGGAVWVYLREEPPAAPKTRK